MGVQYCAFYIQHMVPVNKIGLYIEYFSMAYIMLLRRPVKHYGGIESVHAFVQPPLGVYTGENY